MAGYSRDVPCMDFRKLSHFVTVAETGSLTRAARRLNIVQPALSQSIAKLEQDLGAPLFTRSRHGMALTGAGNCSSTARRGFSPSMIARARILRLSERRHGGWSRSP